VLKRRRIVDPEDDVEEQKSDSEKSENDSDWEDE
jgi:hypothetical protein